MYETTRVDETTLKRQPKGTSMDDYILKISSTEEQFQNLSHQANRRIKRQEMAAFIIITRDKCHRIYSFYSTLITLVAIKS